MNVLFPTTARTRTRRALTACSTIALSLTLAVPLTACRAPLPLTGLGVLPVTLERPHWAATLTPVGAAPVGGALAIMRGDTARTSQILISIERATPNRSYRWQLHTGTCAVTGRPITGAASDTPSLVARADGTAAAEIVMSDTLAHDTRYVVVVAHDDDREANTQGETVACGTLIHSPV